MRLLARRLSLRVWLFAAVWFAIGCGSFGSAFDAVPSDASVADEQAAREASASSGDGTAADATVGDSGRATPADGTMDTSVAVADSSPDVAVVGDSGTTPDAPVDTGPGDSGAPADAGADSDGASTGSVTVGGTVSGLAPGSYVVLGDVGQVDETVTASGAFTFSGTLATGKSYAVTVVTQPTLPSQTCTVMQGTGVVGASNVTSVTVVCTTNSFTVGGTLTGLTPGQMIVLANNGGDALTLGAGGAFTFATPVLSGTAYHVTVLTQPGDAGVTCTVGAGDGTVGASAVTTVIVNCTPGSFLVGGTVMGLVAGDSLILQDNAGDNLFVTSNGVFAFSSAVAAGSPYAVTVLADPVNPLPEVCVVTAGTGTVSGDVSSVVVTCTITAFTVGGALGGLLAGQMVVLADNGGGDITLGSNGAFMFPTYVAQGGAYAVTVVTNPVGQMCTVAAGMGTVSNAAVTSVVVTCTSTSYTVGGTVLGLSGGDSFTLQDNGGDNLVVSANGSFVFPTPVPSGAPYDATLLVQAIDGPCTVGGGSGIVGAANVTSIVVDCSLTTSGTCHTGHNCQFSCNGGSCTQVCQTGATCAVSCGGGSCTPQCSAGATCTFDCPGGSCIFVCPPTALSCTTSGGAWTVPTCGADGGQCMTCPGGGCAVGCASGQSCAETCPGGGCTLTCVAGATCDQSCPGGSCVLYCPPGATCSQQCPGGTCRESLDGG